MKKTKVDIDLDLDEFDKDVAALIPDLISNKTTNRQNARLKLSEISPRILDQIDKLIASKNKQLRWEVAKAFEDRTLSEATPVLLKLLADEESDIRWIAAESLINIGRRSIIPLLHEIIHNETNTIREGAHHVLNSLMTGQEKFKYHRLMKALKHNRAVKGVASLNAKQLLDSLNRSDFL
jgi:HEAT repeat protein